MHHSPDLVPCDFFLFPNSNYHGKRFKSIEDNKRNFTEDLTLLKVIWWMGKHMCIAKNGEIWRGQNKFVRLNINLCVLFNNYKYFLSRERRYIIYYYIYFYCNYYLHNYVFIMIMHFFRSISSVVYPKNEKHSGNIAKN